MDNLSKLLSFLSSPEFAQQALALIAALVAVAHVAEWIASKTPSKADDEAVAKLTKVLNALAQYLPRIGKGSAKLLPLALVCAFAISACAVPSLPPAGRTALDVARDAISLAQLTHSSDANVVRRLEIADSALHAVQLAHDANELRAAAPCAVEALKAAEPDLKSKALKQSVAVARKALEQIGGSCNVDGRNDDAGLPD